MGQNNRHRLGLPNSEIRVQIPGVNVGIGKLRKFTVPQGIKVLEAHSKFKGMDAAQITDIIFKERQLNHLTEISNYKK